MIWLTWRQHRGQLLAAVVALVAFGALLLVTGVQMRGALRESGLAACLERTDLSRPLPTPDSGCAELGAAFASRFFNYRLLGLVAFTVVPLAFGIFWGAPAVAGELERGTHQLVWTQGITRTRWAVVKLASLAVAVLVLATASTLMTNWWMDPLNRATGERFVWLIFDQQGLVPVGYALFGFALGALGGAITRRPQRGVAVMIVAFLAIRFAVAVELRPRYLPQEERTYPVVGTGGPNRLAGDWIIGGGGPGVGGVYAADGTKIKGGQTVCGPEIADECRRELGRGAYNLEIYQPAGRFWTFQGFETSIFVALAGVALATTIVWVRRRLA
jgi:hypothetical protein